jgi:H+-transporting ATPase
MVWSAVGTKLLGTFLAAYGFGLIAPIDWTAIGLVWAYSLIWAFLTDFVKMGIYKHIGKGSSHNRAFLCRIRESLHPGVCPDGRGR